MSDAELNVRAALWGLTPRQSNLFVRAAAAAQGRRLRIG